ncbi:TIGR01777 family oxidoreductase [Croceiramulus getboli]|nr:TIGR01777 family oxidoreductase [Flavobacteriaceae bacterium YJPT1-3]
MRILITGATGLIGQALTRLCHDQGIVVHYLTTSKGKIENTPLYRGFYWDAKTGEIDEAAFEEVDTIIHLAGANIAERWTDKYKKIILESRINTARLLYDTLSRKQTSVKQFISASAIGAYPSSKTKYYTESYPEYNDGFLGTVVKAWEREADRFIELGVEVAKVRIGLVLAEEDGALPQLVKPIAYNVGAPLGSGEQWQSWIHIQDLAGILLFAAQQKLSGVYNAVGPNPVTQGEMTRMIAKILDKSLWLPKVPAWVLKTLLGEMAAVVLESQRVSSDKIEEAGYRFEYQQLYPALEDLLPLKNPT